MFSTYTRTIAEIALLLLILIGCGKPDLGPVPVTAGDSCAHCRMVISEKRFAAEFLESDGMATLFDDIGCLMSFLKNRPGQEVAAIYVADYHTREWIAAGRASYVHSSEFKTPMSGGIVAFSDAAMAAREAEAIKGELWTSGQFLQLLGKN